MNEKEIAQSNNITIKKKTLIVLILTLLAFTAIVASCTGLIVHSNAQNNAKVTLYTAETTSPVDRINSNIVSVVNTVKDTVVEIKATVVSVNIFGRPVTSISSGSGVVISESGAILTNHHVINGATNISVTFTDSSSLSAQLIGSQAADDLAVLKVNASALPFAVFGNSDTLQVGEAVVAIGNPLGTLGGTVTDGIVSALNRDINIDGTVMNLLQTNAAINPGNSGGGLFNLSGELIGIVSAKSSGTNIEGLGFAIPSNRAYQVATNIMQAA